MNRVFVVLGSKFDSDCIFQLKFSGSCFGRLSNYIMLAATQLYILETFSVDEGQNDLIKICYFKENLSRIIIHRMNSTVLIRRSTCRGFKARTGVLLKTLKSVVLRCKQSANHS